MSLRRRSTLRSTGAVIGALCLPGTTVSLEQTARWRCCPAFAELSAISADDASGRSRHPPHLPVAAPVVGGWPRCTANG